jgi:imidazolonepropionase-like amidohydrolase
MKHIIGILLLVVLLNAEAQVPKPAKRQSGPVALMNGIIHIGNGKVIDNGILTFEEGKITSVGDARAVKIDLTGYKVINVTGKHVYPGLILANSNLGLSDINSVRATRDYNEVGEFTPNVRSQIAYNTDSEVIPTLRFNGILLAQVVPQGGIITGTSSIMALEGWNWEDATYIADDGIHLRWPNVMSTPRWWMGETKSKKNENYDITVQRIEQFLKHTRSYINQAQPEENNLKLEAMRGVLEGKKILYVHANGKREIIESVNILERHGLKNLVVVGASDAYYVMDFLKDKNIPVLLSKVHRLPNREEEDVDMPYKLPYLLTEKGIIVGLTYSGSLHSSRNLPFLAGTAAAYGLDKEEALKLITLNPAKILGIDSMTGSLDQGKDANIIVSEGDLLDMRTSKIRYAFIQGKQLNLDGKQQALYKRYKEKYGQ